MASLAGSTRRETAGAADSGQAVGRPAVAPAFLLGHTQLQKELDGLTVTPAGAGFTITGVPKGMAERLKLLTLGVTATGAIEQMRLEEVDGAVTEFRFSQMQEDVPVSDADFRFTPPAGVTVVQGLPPI